MRPGEIPLGVLAEVIELTESGIVWTPVKVDQWLASPSEFLPGNRMIFAGVADPADRADLIAYLIEATTSSD